MPKIKLFLGFILILQTCCSLAQLDIQPQRATATYELGEIGHFKITSPSNAIAQYTIFYDSKSLPIESGKIELSPNGENLIPFEASESGIYLCEIESNGTKALSSIAFSPDQIQEFAQEPKDFDAFWASQKQALATVPIDAEMSWHDTYEDRTIYKVSMATVDNRRVYGFLTVPNGEGKYPAIVTFPPFGNASNLVTPETFLSVQANCIALTISIHNAGVDQVDPQAYQNDIINDRNQFYYKNAILACLRAIDFVTTLDKFDGENIAVNGVSQGGGLAIITAGLDERVNVLGFSNAAMCQHTGFNSNKASGFPYYLFAASSSNDNENDVNKAVRYYDAIYFAKRFKGAVYATISAEDIVCPAATVIAAYNQFRGSKMAVHSLNLGHDTPNEYWVDRVPYFRNFIPSMETPSVPWLSGTSYLANAGADQTVAVNVPTLVNGQVSFDGISNQDWKVNWDKIEGPGSAKFSDSSSRQTNVTFAQTGTYVLRFVAYNDDRLLSDEKRFIIEDFITITVE